MAFSWYALHSKPRKEELVFQQLLLRNIEAFFPRLKVNPVNPRSAKVRPYFPGYVFIHIDLIEIGISTILWLPGAIGLVSFGGEPAVVPDGLITIIHQKLDRVNSAGGEFFEELKHGEKVRISDGPFAGYEGVFDARLSGSERVRILIKQLQKRQYPVELPSKYLVRVVQNPISKN